MAKQTSPLCPVIGNFSELPYNRKIICAELHKENYHFVICSSCDKVAKSLMSEGFRELKWTCPLCSI